MQFPKDQPVGIINLLHIQYTMYVTDCFISLPMPYYLDAIYIKYFEINMKFMKLKDDRKCCCSSRVSNLLILACLCFLLLILACLLALASTSTIYYLLLLYFFY